ncbi:hypothetical protein [Brevibacterium spongiae]|uniref:Uncharacterized protein n=1 Tax=Brevibacterium spongiae TaxID=2909672 RepID=A0ABY5SQR3_9MICO|nr:hypothetical protein [Brevibacterium spongiae]UVI36900.1 hypothetical protein L1F31_04385 [Brevibacterium spongiae]
MRIAQALSLFTLVLWIAMLWVPVLASPEDTSEPPRPPRIIVTALGGPAFDFAEAQVSTVLVALGVLTCTAASFLLTVRSRADSHPWPEVAARVWSVGALVLGVTAFLVLVTMVTNLPTLMWDAVDDRGLPVFGVVIAQPAMGAGLWSLGCLCLLTAGLCGLLGDHRRRRADHRQETASDRGAKFRITDWPRGNRTYRWAQRLPWVAVAAWVLMIWVPLFDSGDHGAHSLTITSIGRAPFDPSDLTPAVVLPWAVVLACAVTAKRFDAFAYWPVLPMSAGVGLLIVESMLVLDLPRERVESTLAEGGTISAYIVADPAAGLHLWTIGCWALITASVCGFLCVRRRKDRRGSQLTGTER